MAGGISEEKKTVSKNIIYMSPWFGGFLHIFILVQVVEVVTEKLMVSV